MNELNEDFEVSIGLEEEEQEKPKDKRGEAVKGKRGKTVKVEEQPKKAERVAIFIDEEDGMSNYVPVGVNGKVYQIMRGTVVMVPPEVVHVLENAIAMRTVQKKNPVTGQVETDYKPYCSVPWRRA